MEKLQEIKNNIGKATLVAVTKYASLEQVKELIKAGQKVFGESKVQQVRERFKLFKEDNISWHMIGHLQKNKVKYAVKLFDLIQSVDSLELAQEIDKEANKIGKIQDILIQVNIGEENQKFGVSSEKINSFIDSISELQNIKIKGLMAMAPFFDDSEKTRPYFKAMKQLFDKFDFEILSMGMSQDYHIAIQEGANMVRIGSALFE